jgi:predicted enzyme related to lactoylglutathione lyase
MARVTHFEILVDDPQRAITFYKDVFGWEINKWEGGSMDYWLIRTGKDPEPGINGGLMKRMKSAADSGGDTAFVCTVDVPNYDEYAEKIKKSGGKAVTEKTEIPKVGWMSYFKDTEGNNFGIMESMPNAVMQAM